MAVLLSISLLVPVLLSVLILSFSEDLLNLLMLGFLSASASLITVPVAFLYAVSSSSQEGR